MFTGIITHTGTIKKIEKKGDWKFTIAVPNFTRDLTLGASVCHSGCCLTVIEMDDSGFVVQVSGETLDRSTLGSWVEGQKINLERALTAGTELGGHFVTGHVDAVVKLVAKTPAQESFKLDISLPKNIARFIAEKGSVTLDGISLTVNTVADESFSVNIIPHTLQSTTLGERAPGDSLNLEIDIIARYLARLNQFS